MLQRAEIPVSGFQAPSNSLPEPWDGFLLTMYRTPLLCNIHIHFYILCNSIENWCLCGTQTQCRPHIWYLIFWLNKKKKHGVLNFQCDSARKKTTKLDWMHIWSLNIIKWIPISSAIFKNYYFSFSVNNIWANWIFFSILSHFNLQLNPFESWQVIKVQPSTTLVYNIWTRM